MTVAATINATALVRRGTAVLALAALLGLGAACGDDDAATDASAAADGSTSTSGPTGTSGYHLLSPAEFEAQMASTPEHVINVHVPYEGELPGTTAFIDYQVIQGDSKLPADRSAPLLLYCRSGRMSKIAADTLLADGYTNLYDLSGGMVAWEASGKKIEHQPGH